VPVDLTPILNHAPAWLLVLFRLTGIFVLAPMFGSEAIPRQVRVFLALGLSFCVYPMLLTPGSSSAVNVGFTVDHGVPLWPVLGMVGVELLIGFAVGFAASLPMIGMQVGGQVIDQQMGLGFAGVVNPEFGEEAGIIARLMFLMSLTIFIILGGHRAMLATLIGSFDKVPLGGFDDLAGLATMMVGLLDVTFDMAFRIAAPLLCVMFLVQISLGFIMRTVPQVNVLSVGFIIRILLGAVFMSAFVGIAAGVFVDHAHLFMHHLIRLFTHG